MPLSSTALSRLTAAALLALCSQQASATLITYSFTGATEGSYQQNYSYTTTSSGVTTYDSGNGYCNNCATGSMSFTVDASQYSNVYVGTPGLTYHTTTGSTAAPWLSSQTNVSGPHRNGQLITAGNEHSYLHSYNNAYGGSQGYFTAYDFAVYDTGTSTYDSLGRLTSSSYTQNYNYVRLVGDVTLGLVDGQELPIGLSNWTSSYFYQYLYELDYLYTYDDLGAQTAVLADYVYEYTYLPIAALSITRSDAPVNGVPEPGTLALLGLGGVLLAWRRRRS